MQCSSLLELYSEFQYYKNETTRVVKKIRESSLPTMASACERPNIGTRRQRALIRTGVTLLRYIMDHPQATSRAAAEDLRMSFPNVCRLVTEFKTLGIIQGTEHKQTGRRGPWSQAVALRGDLGCTIGVDLEATKVRGVVLDFANNVLAVRRRSLSPFETDKEIVSIVASVATTLVHMAQARGVQVYIVGLGLPSPLLDKRLGKIRTNMQFGEATLEFVPRVEEACRIRTSAAPNSNCFAAGHHRIHNPRGRGIDMVVLNRFGIVAALVWKGELYTGASHYAGALGYIPCSEVYPPRPLKEVCTGSSLLEFARAKGDQRSFQELLKSPNDPLVQEWLKQAVPAFAQAIHLAIMTYNPDRVLIDGIFNKFPRKIRSAIVARVQQLVLSTGNMMPEITFYEGDDLMGARGAALLARDLVANDALASIIIREGLRAEVPAIHGS